MEGRTMTIGDDRLARQPGFEQHYAETFAGTHIAQEFTAEQSATDDLTGLASEIAGVCGVDGRTIIIRTDQHDFQFMALPIEVFDRLDDPAIALGTRLPTQ